jgi:copper(I)-binding protein
MKQSCYAALLSLLVAGGAMAQVTVTEPWVRATVPAAKASGAFMQLKSARDARLLEVRSDVAASVEIHQMVMDGQTMKMRPVQGVDLPAGKTVSLVSGGYHVMLMGLKQQMKAGETVPLTLVVQTRGGSQESIAVKAIVQPLTYMPGGMAH